MPTIGDETRGKDLGYTSSPTVKTIFVWVQCLACKEERWARKKPVSNPVNNTRRLCVPCAVKQAKNFRINPERAAIEGRI